MRGVVPIRTTDSRTMHHAVRSRIGDARDHILPSRPFGDVPIYRKTSCACGGVCPACQAKSADLKISQPNDPAEIEADHIADRVMGMSAEQAIPVKHITPASPLIHRKCDSCEEESEPDEEIFRKELAGATSSEPPSDPRHVTKALSEGGHGLSSETRSFFEPRLGYDLSAVRIHTGSAASHSARSLKAEAYTLGEDIVFNEGRYRPGDDDGRQLLAHELAHVAQQLDRGRLSRKIQPAYGAKCLKLTSDRSIRGLIRGTEAHSLITEDFKSRVIGATGASIPGASADVFRTDAICGGPSTLVDPEEIGEPGSMASRGKVDLARKKGTTLEVAEIKPAAMECLIDGEAQVARYVYQGNSDMLPEGRDDDELRSWKRRKGIKTLVPMKSSTYPAKTIRVLDVQGELRIDMAWCNPGLVAYKVTIDDKKKKKDTDKDKKKDKAADSPDAEKKPNADAPHSPDGKKPKTDVPDSPDGKKPKTDLPDTPDAKTLKPKPKLKNFGLGICLFCDVGGGANVGVGVGLFVDGQSYGTVSAGVIYDSSGNAVGSVSAGAASQSSGGAAGTIGASLSSSTSAESGASAGANMSSDSSSMSLGGASFGKASASDTNALAGASKGESSNVQGNSILSATSGKAADSSGEMTKKTGSGEVSGATGKSGATQDLGTPPPPGSDARIVGATGTTGGVQAQREGKRQVPDGGTTPGTDGGSTTTYAGEGPGGVDQSPNLQIPGTTPEQLKTAIAEAAELDKLLQSATPAQRQFMEFLAGQEKAGYFPVSKIEWVKNVMQATQGLDENGAQTLSQYSWADSNASAGDLKKAVDEALARSKPDEQQTSHNYIYGQRAILPFASGDLDWETVANAALIHDDKLKVGKRYKGLVVFYFKKKDGSDFYARVFEVDLVYESVNRDDEEGKPHHFIFGSEIDFYSSDGVLLANYRGFSASDEGFSGL